MLTFNQFVILKYDSIKKEYLKNPKYSFFQTCKARYNEYIDIGYTVLKLS